MEAMRLCYTGPNNQHTKRWVNAFAQRGHEVHLVVDAPTGSDETMDYEHITVYPLNLIQAKNPRYFFKKLFILRQLLKKIKPDVLHTHYLTGEGYIGALSGFHPYVVTIWGNDIYIRPYKRFEERLFTQYTLKQADLVTADSQDQINAAIRLGSHPSKSAIIQWGVDLTRFHSDKNASNMIRASLGIGDAPIVINQRSCIPLYNVDIIVRSFANTLQIVPDAHLLITGGGSLTEDKVAVSEIHNLVRKIGIEDHVHFTGYLPYDELPAYIAAADVTVSVPSSDGTSMSLLEGMACGAVPVVSDLPSNREWITDGFNGYIVPIRDRAALAGRLIELLLDRDRCRLFAQRNVRIIEERADHHASMDRMEMMYKKLIDQAKPRRRSSGVHADFTRSALPASGGRPRIKPFPSLRHAFHAGTAALRDYSRPAGGAVHALDMHILEAAQWLVRARTAHDDGGCAKCFNLLTGTWEASYPETSGYIIPTFLHLAHHYEDETYLKHAEGIGAWLMSLQLDTGAFPWLDLRTPLVFDTGQILHGLISLWRETEESRYLEAAHRAATWLMGVQETNGSWLQHEYRARPHAYNTLVSWALARIWQATDHEGYRTAAIGQLDWALTQQRPNGWFDRNSLDKDARPILHTIVYAAQGLLESGLILRDDRYIHAARSTMQSLAERYRVDNKLAGAYDENWRGVVSSRCLTGEAQLAGLGLRWLEACRDDSYRDTAVQLNTGLKRTQNLTTTNLGVRGGIQGSFPIYGAYMTFKYPNWAVKYYIDSLLLEAKLRGRTASSPLLEEHQP